MHPFSHAPGLKRTATSIRLLPLNRGMLGTHTHHQMMPFLKDPACVAGFFPVNRRDTGAGVEVWLRDGSVLSLNLTTTSLLNKLADVYLLNLGMLKKYLHDVLAARYYLPLPFSRDLVLVPVKTREKLVAGDSLTGYVNACALQDITVQKRKNGHNESGDEPPGLLLADGRRFPCLTSQAVVNQRMHRAQFSLLMLEQHFLTQDKSERVAEGENSYGLYSNER